MVTGTSVLGIKFQDGVMLAADNLGPSAPYIRDCSTLTSSVLRIVGSVQGHSTSSSPRQPHCSGRGGRYVGFPMAEKASRCPPVRLVHSLRGERVLMDRREHEAIALTDSHPPMSPSNIYDYLSTLLYARRSKMNPIWNAILVGGWEAEKQAPYVPPLLHLVRRPLMADSSDMSTCWGPPIPLPR